MAGLAMRGEETAVFRQERASNLLRKMQLFGCFGAEISEKRREID
jgi:hypothetical protein